MALPATALARPEIRVAVERGYKKLAGMMRPTKQVIRAGSTIVEQDAPHDFTYRLESGWLARSRQMPDGQRQIITVFLPGEIFCAKCLLMGQQPDSIFALSDAVVSAIHRHDLLDLIREDPEVGLLLTLQLAEDERRLHNWTVAFGRPALDRIGLMLWDFRERLARIGLLHGDTFKLPMTQTQIADRTGLSDVHVNRTLRIIRDRQIAVVGGGTATIVNADALKEIAWPALDVFDRQAAGSAR